jgi:hypothetical protein
MPENEGRILERLDHIAADLTEIKASVLSMNGRVRQNELNVAILSETCLRFKALQIGAIIGAAIAIIGIIAWLSGAI